MININAKSIAVAVISLSVGLPLLKAVQVSAASDGGSNSHRNSAHVSARKPASDYNDFLVDSNNKLLRQLQDEKRENIKLNTELSNARQRIRELETKTSESGEQLKNAQPDQSQAVPPSPSWIDPAPPPVRPVFNRFVSKNAAEAENDLNSIEQSTSAGVTINPSILKFARTHGQYACSGESDYSDFDYETKTMNYYLQQMENQIAASASESTNAKCAGMSGSILFDIADDGAPSFVDENVEDSSADFESKAKEIIAKAGPFRHFREARSSNRLEAQLRLPRNGELPQVKLNMI